MSNFTPPRDSEYNKFSLESFFVNHTNRFDPAIAQLKVKLLKELNEVGARMSDLSQDNPEVMANSVASYTPNQIDALNEMTAFVDFYHYYHQDLLALMETQIIYAFKHLEIGMKIILSAAYGKENVKHFDKWENLNTFLKAHEIDIKTIEGYKEVNQLRNVNNNLKHSSTPDSAKLQGIKEVSEKTEFQPFDLVAFYDRVKDYPEAFLSSLSYAISEERYSFSESKIDKIAEEIYSRMDSKTAEQFISVLKRKYE